MGDNNKIMLIVIATMYRYNYKQHVQYLWGPTAYLVLESSALAFSLTTLVASSAIVSADCSEASPYFSLTSTNGSCSSSSYNSSL